MFDKLLEKIQRVDEIESKLLSIFEGKSWEYIAKALYTILDDIDTASDMCKDNYKAYQDVVMELQAKKNDFLSSDGYTLKPVEEIDSDSEEEPNNSMLQPDEEEEAHGLMKFNTNECVCHIDGLSDVELLKFYSEMNDSYVRHGAQKQLPEDRANVEMEIQNRGLDVRANGKKFGVDVPPIGGIGECLKEFFDHKRDGKDEEYLINHARSRFGQSKLADVLCENLTDHARKELELAGMFDKDVDGSEAAGSWNRLCAEAVMELMEVFAEQGHSGFSASMTQDLFSRLAKYEKLTELTDNPDEWRDVSEFQSGKPGWQSTRSPSCFSENGGKTYWDIDEDWNKHEDEDGTVWSGGGSVEEWDNRPIHQSKHFEKKE